MWSFFALSMGGIFLSIFFLIRRYAARNLEVAVQLATAYAWLTSMMVIALVPIDVWGAYTQSPSTKPIFILWNIAYWTTQVATWLVLPFYQQYSEAGDFTVKARCWTSLRENGLLLGAVAVLGAIGGLVVLVSTGLSSTERYIELLNIAIFASNAFGLVAGLLLMGYGLVQIPRSMWATSNPETKLKWCAHRCGKFAEAIMKSTTELETVVTIVYANQRQMRRTDPLKKYMDVIADQAERDSPIKPSEIAQRNVDFDSLAAEDLEYNYDERGLAELRKRMCYAIAGYQGAHSQYESAMLEAFELEDIVKCRSLKEYSPRVPEGTQPSTWTSTLWQYKCLVQPYASRLLAVLLAFIGCCIVWGEMTILSKQDLSPFSKLIRATQQEFVFQVLTVLPLVYMCACTYYALFKLNAFNYNKLVEGATTGTALMQNGSLMCRFAAPTCWNFYHIIRFAKDFCSNEDQEAHLCQQTVFSRIMGTMANVSAFKYLNINTYLPVLLVLHCAMVAFGVWDRLANMFVSPRFRFSTDDVDDEYTEKGRLLIRKEQEASYKGFKIGQVLHSAWFDLEFPTLAANRQGQKKKGWFSGWFRRRQDPAAAAASSAPKQPSAATQAAARWLRGGGAQQGAAGRADAEFGDAADNPKTSLLSATFDHGGGSSSRSSATGGLDGIFADLGTRFGGSRAPGGAPASGAAGPAEGGAPKLVFGKK